MDEFRNPMKKRVENTAVKETVFETISNTDANVLSRGDRQLYLIKNVKKQTINLDYLLLTLNVTEQFLKNPKQKRPFFFLI